jgi:hypothetical protein
MSGITRELSRLILRRTRAAGADIYADASQSRPRVGEQQQFRGRDRRSARERPDFEYEGKPEFPFLYRCIERVYIDSDKETATWKRLLVSGATSFKPD